MMMMMFLIRGKKRGNKLEQVFLEFTVRNGVVLFVLGKQIYWLSVLMYNRSRAFSTVVLPVPAFSPQTERGISSGKERGGPRTPG